MEMRPNEVRSSDGIDAIIPAAANGYVRIVRTLSDNGEDVHGSNPTAQYSAISSCCQRYLSGDIEAVEALQQTNQLLLKHGVII